MTYYLIPVFVLAGLLISFGLLVFLGRFRKGRYLKPLMLGLMKVPLLRRLLERAQEAALERQNPDLMSVKRKLERPGVQMDPAKAQQVLQQLSPGERRAYNDYLNLLEEQGVAPEAPNRQARRRMERQFGQPRPPGGGSRKRKKR